MYVYNVHLDKNPKVLKILYVIHVKLYFSLFFLDSIGLYRAYFNLKTKIQD